MSEGVKMFLDFGGLGFLVFMAYVIFQAYRASAERLMGVIENNTAAITKLCGQTSSTDAMLKEHDQQAKDIRADVQKVRAVQTEQGQVLARIEQKVSK